MIFENNSESRLFGDQSHIRTLWWLQEIYYYWRGNAQFWSNWHKITHEHPECTRAAISVVITEKATSSLVKHTHTHTHTLGMVTRKCTHIIGSSIHSHCKLSTWEAKSQINKYTIPYTNTGYCCNYWSQISYCNGLLMVLIWGKRRGSQCWITSDNRVKCLWSKQPLLSVVCTPAYLSWTNLQF